MFWPRTLLTATGGVDTPKHTHYAAVIGDQGRLQFLRGGESLR